MKAKKSPAGLDAALTINRIAVRWVSDGTEKHDGIDKAGDCQRDQGTGDIVDAVVDTVSGTLTNTIKGSGAVATSLVRILSETAHASI